MEAQEILDASKKTAMTRKNPTIPQKIAVKLGLPTNPCLDWGCGKGSDTKHLQDLGFEVFGYDPNYQPNLPEGKFKYGQCFYVLNTLPGETLRVKALQEMKKHLEKKATVFVAARSEKEIQTERTERWKKVEDGWVTPKGTFQKGLSPEELRRYLQLAGFINIVDHSNNRCTCAQASLGGCQ